MMEFHIRMVGDEGNTSYLDNWVSRIASLNHIEQIVKMN